VLISATVSTAQTRRRSAPKKTTTPSTSYADKQQAEIRAGRERIALQIKTLTQYLYLYAGISKGIETAELVNRNSEQTAAGLPPEQVQRNKAKVNDSIHNVRVGLDQLETSFRTNPVLTNYYSSISGVAKLGQTAETQAAGGNLDQAGKTLISVVNRLTDALVTLR
jgi:hypothetical protein